VDGSGRLRDTTSDSQLSTARDRSLAQSRRRHRTANSTHRHAGRYQQPPALKQWRSDSAGKVLTAPELQAKKLKQYFPVTVG